MQVTTLAPNAMNQRSNLQGSGLIATTIRLDQHDAQYHDEGAETLAPPMPSYEELLKVFPKELAYAFTASLV